MDPLLPNQPLRVILLGTGTSTGVPTIGSIEPVNRGFDPRDKRTRSSIVVQWPAAAHGLSGADGSGVARPARWCSVLIDTTPELRLQALRCGVDTVDAVIYTHTHADHLMGLDDLRQFSDAQRQPAMPVFAEQASLDHMRQCFGYAVGDGARQRVPGRPMLEPTVVRPLEPFDVLGRTVTGFRVFHGRSVVLGIRIGGLCYCTDVSQVPEESIPLMMDASLLVLDALRFTPHPTHLSLQQAVSLSERLRAKRVLLTHIGLDFLTRRIREHLPPHIALGFDGQVIELSG